MLAALSDGDGDATRTNHPAAIPRPGQTGCGRKGTLNMSARKTKPTPQERAARNRQNILANMTERVEWLNSKIQDEREVAHRHGFQLIWGRDRDVNLIITSDDELDILPT